MITSMPYYVFKITQPTPILKNLNLQDSFEEYRAARVLARSLRADLPANTPIMIKIIHAASILEAEEQLYEKRDKPILREWEK
jgi:hypothetical protein